MTAIDVARRAWDTFVAQDPAGAALWAPDMEIHAHGWPDSPVFHGAAGFREFARTWVAAWRERSFEFEELRDLGAGRALLVYRQNLTARETDLEFSERGAVIYTVHAGLIARQDLFRDVADALAAVEQLDQ